MVLNSCTKSPTMEQVGVSIKFIHTSPNAASIQFKLNGENVHTPALNYRDTTTYLPFEGGTYNLNATVGTSVPVNTVVDFVPRSFYSVYAVDSVGKLKVAIVKDNVVQQTTPLRASARFFNFSPNAGPLSLVTVHNTDTIVFSGSRLFNDLVNSQTAGMFRIVPSNVYDLLLFSGSTLVYKLPAQPLLTFKSYTIYARGFLGGTGNQALSLGITRHN